MIHFFTICLDGMPFITNHLPVFNRLTVPWAWTVVEGVARNVACTRWCKTIYPRLSQDGTTEYLNSIKGHPRVKIHRREEWAGKIEMVNLALAGMTTPGILMQLDADELWLPHQLEQIAWMFRQNPTKNCARFFCRYFVGGNLAITSRGTYGNKPGEWLRAWRFSPGMSFLSHEPPVLSDLKENAFTQEETERMGLVFDHYAYATEAQVAFKESYYGYRDAVVQWKTLQTHQKFPVKLKNFLPWVRDNAEADLLIK